MEGSTLTPRAREIVKSLGLSSDGWERSPSGFTNEVWISSGFVLKVYLGVSRQRETEKAFYRLAPVSGMPKALETGEDFLLMENTGGVSLFSVWPDLDDQTRKRLFSEACGLARGITELPESILPHDPVDDWSKEISGRILNACGLLNNDFPDSVLIERCRKAVSLHRDSLGWGNRWCWMHPDFHFDNLIWNRDTGRLFLLDFEDLCYAPADYFLDTPLRMIRYPHLYANEYDDPRQRKEDYIGLTEIMEEQLPVCFSHPQNRIRTALYALAYDLKHLSRSPQIRSLVLRAEGDLEIMGL